MGEATYRAVASFSAWIAPLYACVAEAALMMLLHTVDVQNRLYATSSSCVSLVQRAILETNE